MSETITLKSDDPIIEKLNFRPYRSSVERHVKRFLPPPDAPQQMDVETPWGEILVASAGDYLVSELDNPEDQWPIKAQIFEETYVVTRPGYCVKRGLTMLTPLVNVTSGDPEAEVVVETLEGSVSVRAGDFYLARGVEGEIWPYPAEKVGKTIEPVEE